MRQRITLLVSIVVLVALVIGGGYLLWQNKPKADSATPKITVRTTEPQFVSNQILIKFKKDSVTRVQAKQSQTRAKEPPTVSATDTGIAQLDKINSDFKVTGIQKSINSSSGVQTKSVNSGSDLDQWYTLNLNIPKKVLTGDPSKNIIDSKDPKQITYQNLLETYRQTDGVLTAEPVYIVKTSMIPNDSLYSSYDYTSTYTSPLGDLWNLKKIGAEQAWDKTTGNGVVVAVVDSGVDYNHPDLKNSILKDANGKIIGYNIVDNNADPIDNQCGHGTHVAGIIAAQGNNDIDHTVDQGTRMIGVGPNLKIMPIKVMHSITDDYGTYCGSDDLSPYNGIVWAVDHGAKVINNSWGGWGDSQLARDTIKYAHDKSVVVVFAAGNDNFDIAPNAEAGDPNAITVGASNIIDLKSSFSNFGSQLDFLAPGGDQSSGNAEVDSEASIVSTASQLVAHHDYYIGEMGTSMAAPAVAGAAGLVLSLHPDWTPEEVRFALRNSTSPVNNQTWSSLSGFGEINLDKALKINQAPPVATLNIPKFFNYNVHDIYGSVSARSGVKSWVLEASLASRNNQSLTPTTWKTIATGTTTINGKLATLDNSYDGYYLVRLKVIDQNNQLSQTYSNLTMDKNIIPGWPKITTGYAEKIQPAIADINGDGQNEIISTSSLNCAIELDAYRANGTELPNFPQEINFDHCSSNNTDVTSPVIGDINKDGKPEIIFSSKSQKYSGQNAQVKDELYAYDGSGKSLPGWPVEFGDSVANYDLGLPLIADINGDSYPEVLMQTSFGKIFAFNKSGQQISGWPVVMNPGSIMIKIGYGNVGAPAVGDINNDGKVEIIASFGTNLFAYDSSGKILSGWPVNIQDENPNKYPDGSKIVLADINNDGSKEIIARTIAEFIYGDEVYNHLIAFKNNGSQLWSFDTSRYFDYALRWNHNDGESLPLIVENANSKNVLLSTINKLFSLDNKGNLMNNYPINLTNQAYFNGEELAVADVNNDGQPEFIMPVGEQYRSLVINNLANTKTVMEKGFNGAFQTGSVGDIDGDGKLELVANIITGMKDENDNTSYASALYVWRLPDSSVPKNTIAWGQIGGNAQHSSTYPLPKIAPVPTPSASVAPIACKPATVVAAGTGPVKTVAVGGKFNIPIKITNNNPVGSSCPTVWGVLAYPVTGWSIYGYSINLYVPFKNATYRVINIAPAQSVVTSVTLNAPTTPATGTKITLKVDDYPAGKLITLFNTVVDVLAP